MRTCVLVTIKIILLVLIPDTNKTRNATHFNNRDELQVLKTHCKVYSVESGLIKVENIWTANYLKVESSKEILLGIYMSLSGYC